jgi:hypothetical protein
MAGLQADPLVLIIEDDIGTRLLYSRPSQSLRLSHR